MSQPLDDATEHLLLNTSSQHLPPPGIEQVFEAESTQVGIFTRERSKLSREERIRLSKAKRESGVPLFASGVRSSLDGTTLEEQRPLEKWGPGGEVVQELKDVIWKVGEKRRKMSGRYSPSLPRDSLDLASPSMTLVEPSTPTRTSHRTSMMNTTYFPSFDDDEQIDSNRTSELSYILEPSS